MKVELLIASISITVTLIISAIFGFAGASIIGTFWAWFWISLLVQIIGFAVWNTQTQTRLAIETAAIEELQAERISQTMVKIKCAYCEQQNTVPVRLNQKNSFKCESCNQVNGLHLQFMAATLTTPLEVPKLPIDEEINVTAG